MYFTTDRPIFSIIDKLHLEYDWKSWKDACLPFTQGPRVMLSINSMDDLKSAHAQTSGIPYIA